jgi:recombinational DNA repair protein (RecF pathway)
MAKRIADEPAFVLHRYDWSESSLILELLTRHIGRDRRGGQGRQEAQFQLPPVLLPLQPLHVAFGGDAEIRTLKSAEWLGGQVMPTGEALLSGYYLNELLLRLLARDDPHPPLFDVYAAAVRVLAADDAQLLQPALRAFELLLLREIGLLPTLDMQTGTLAPLVPDERYSLRAEGGLVEAADADGRGRPDRRAVAAAAGRPGRSRAFPRGAGHGVDVRRAQAAAARAAALPFAAFPTLRTRQLIDGPAGPVSCVPRPAMTSASTALSVNLNKVALVRNTRHLGIPSVTRAATLCLQAGAHGITVHPRPDARHVRPDDVARAACAAPARLAGGRVQHRGQPFHNLMDFVRELRPHQCTFVPDSEGQFTSDHGWDLRKDGERVRPLIAEAKALGCG